MITLCGGEKGGTGKSTIAQNLSAWLAQAGQRVLLVDADLQATSMMWAGERRANPDLPLVYCTAERGGDMGTRARKHAEDFDQIVIDAGGQDSDEFRAAMTVADVMVSPLRPTQIDMWTVKQLAAMVAMARSPRVNPSLDVRIVLNQVSNNWKVSKATDAKKWLESHQLTVVSVLHHLDSFDDAANEGRGVFELNTKKAQKARDEINALALEIYGEIQGRHTAAA